MKAPLSYLLRKLLNSNPDLDNKIIEEILNGKSDAQEIRVSLEDGTEVVLVSSRSYSRKQSENKSTSKDKSLSAA